MFRAARTLRSTSASGRKLFLSQIRSYSTHISNTSYAVKEIFTEKTKVAFIPAELQVNALMNIAENIKAEQETRLAGALIYPTLGLVSPPIAAIHLFVLATIMWPLSVLAARCVIW